MARKKTAPTTADEVLHALKAMTPREQRRFSDHFAELIADDVSAMAINAVLDALERHPEAAADRERLRAYAAEEYGRVLKAAKEAAVAEAKAARAERGSSPQTIHRNVEICDQRAAKPAFWTITRLASHHDVDRKYIRTVLTEAAKWRSLADDLKGGGETN